MTKRTAFKVFVTKDYLKFSSAHFIAYRGFRETLHGHNYRLSVEVEGTLGPDGYVVDFGIVKKAAREICGRLDGKTIVPMESDCVSIESDDRHVVMITESGRFSLPRGDCVLLPLVHSSVEELARYLAGEICQQLAADGIAGISAIQVGVEETTGQAAYFRAEEP